jgi:hypothetical protein
MPAPRVSIGGGRALRLGAHRRAGGLRVGGGHPARGSARRRRYSFRARTQPARGATETDTGTVALYADRALSIAGPGGGDARGGRHVEPGRVTAASPRRVTSAHPYCGHPPPMAASNYEFRIRGRLSDPVLARFDMLEPDAPCMETILHGPVRDQAEFRGILERVQSLGLELLEVRRLPE